MISLALDLCESAWHTIFDFFFSLRILFTLIPLHRFTCCLYVRNTIGTFR